MQENAAGFGVGLVALTDVEIALDSAAFGFPEVGTCTTSIAEATALLAAKLAESQGS